MKMKFFFPVLFVFMLALTADAFAQRAGRQGNVRPQQRFAERTPERVERPRQMFYDDCILPDLTEEQQTAMREHRLARMEASTTHRNQMNELRARKRNLMTQPEKNREAIHSIIDEMTVLQNTKMKDRVAHREAIREILTEEQRIIYDNRSMRRPGERSPQGRHGNAPRMRCW